MVIDARKAQRAVEVTQAAASVTSMQRELDAATGLVAPTMLAITRLQPRLGQLGASLAEVLTPAIETQRVYQEVLGPSLEHITKQMHAFGIQFPQAGKASVRGCRL